MMNWFKKLITGQPHFVVMDGEQVYLRRWWIIPRNRFFNVYLHNFQGSDNDRALHDHPWHSFSIMLKGHLVEHTAAADYVSEGNTETKDITARQMNYRKPEFLHRLELVSPQAWTIFITGPTVRVWGFLMPSGKWLRFNVFLAAMENRDISDALQRAELLESPLISDADYQAACEELRS